MNERARRVNSLASSLSAKTYLEIGVQDGHTFREIEIPTRTAVDPEFRFDIKQIENEQTKFFPQTSDAYFSDSHDGSPFDIIFIDGLHQFEQVVRDFSNAVTYSHPTSVIVLDDTRPNDVYSAIPDLHQTIRFRQEAGVVHPAWHGDVYKAVIYIHDFWPSWNYRTISESGNPQTIVWRSNKFRRTPRFNNLEVISRMSFFDLMNNIDMLRECSEGEALDACISELRGAV